MGCFFGYKKWFLTFSEVKGVSSVGKLLLTFWKVKSGKGEFFNGRRPKRSRSSSSHFDTSIMVHFGSCLKVCSGSFVAPLSRPSSCRAGDGVPSQLRAVGSKSSVDHAHPQSSGFLLLRCKARARAPRSQRQPLQNRGNSSRSRSRKATWHRSRRSGLLGQTPSPQFWPVSDTLSAK